MPLTAKDSPGCVADTPRGGSRSAGCTRIARFWGANPRIREPLPDPCGTAYAISEAWAHTPRTALNPRASGMFRCSSCGRIPNRMVPYQAQIAPKPIVLWWLAAAWVLAATGLILVIGGWSHLRRLAFPLGFIFFALPVPSLHSLATSVHVAIRDHNRRAAWAAADSRRRSRTPWFHLESSQRRSRRRGSVQWRALP